MNNKDLQFLQEAVEKAINPKLQGLQKFMEHEKDLGDPDQFEILNTDTEYSRHGTRAVHLVAFKAKGDYYDAEYEFTWFSEYDNPDHDMNLLSLKRYADEDYSQVDAEIPKGSPLFKDAEEKIESLVYNDKLQPNVPVYYYRPEY